MPLGKQTGNPSSVDNSVQTNVQRHTRVSMPTSQCRLAGSQGKPAEREKLKEEKATAQLRSDGGRRGAPG